MCDLKGTVTLSPEEIKNFEVRLGGVFFTRTSETVDEVGIASVMLEEPRDTVFSGFVLRARPLNGRLDSTTLNGYCSCGQGDKVSQSYQMRTNTTRAP